MKQVSLRPIKIGYGEEKYIFYPRMFSVAEQDEVQSRFTDIADDACDKYQKEFEICREAIVNFSAKDAVVLVKEKGEFKENPLDGGVTGHFAERTTANERIIREVYQLYLIETRPESSFL